MGTGGVQKSGIDVVGDIVSWGNHFCLFYETKEDLLDTLVSYCKSGLEGNEYCLWVVAEPLTVEEATDALKNVLPELDRYLAHSDLELASARDWFLEGSTFDGSKAQRNWHDRLARAGAKRYRGVRATGDTTWLGKKDWPHWCNFEDGMNEVFRALVSSWPPDSQRLAMLCTYPLAGCGAPQILDVVRTHQFVLARRYGNWDIVETAGLKQAKAEIQRLNEELEQRVVERTEKLHEAQAELAHVNRVTTMGQLAASISHEVMQPISAGINNVQTALRFLGDQPPDLEEARQALGRALKDAKRAGEIMSRIRAHIKKVPSTKSALDLNNTIREVIALTRGEVTKNQVSVRAQLTEGLPLIQADRVQVQQVVLNLILNAIQAMAGVREGTRQLLIRTGKDASDGVFVAVHDSGPGLPSGSTDQLFEPFYSTKPSGMGMGLSICRSIVEDHGGRIWASPERGAGATVQFTLPIEGTREDAAA